MQRIHLMVDVGRWVNKWCVDVGGRLSRSKRGLSSSELAHQAIYQPQQEVRPDQNEAFGGRVRKYSGHI